MLPAAGGSVPAGAHWLLAHEGCGAILWTAHGAIAGANALALRLLGLPTGGWLPGRDNIREAFGAFDAADDRALADALGSRGGTERILPTAGGGALRVFVTTWPLGGAVPAMHVTMFGELGARGEGDRPSASAVHRDLLYQRSPLMYFQVALDGRVVSVNQVACDQLLYGPDELVGRPIGDVFHPDDREGLSEQLARCMCEPTLTHSWELRKRRRDGELIWVAEWARVVAGRHGAPEMLIVCEDISARKRAEQALRDTEARFLQAQKQEALGRLAGGIAHDFSNLLTVVLGHCDAAGQQLPRQSAVHDELQGIREAAQQATNLSRQLLTFSRRQVVQPQPLQLDDVVARMTPLFRRLLGARIKLEVVWVPGLPRVLADAGQMEQVLTNLMVNARDAVSEQGTVRIGSSLVSARAFTADTGVAAMPERSYLCISIRDNGTGMTAEVRSRVFEPFFTTKADGRGTGLGLPTVQSIVVQAGGGVTVHSEPGEGCDVRVYLPALGQGRVPEPATIESRPMPGGHETVLLVEDREAVRRVAQRFLSRRGYGVIEAANAEEALALTEAHTGTIDLLLTDVVLGGMDGYELALTLTARTPGLRVVLMSGYPSEMLAHAGRTGPIFPFVNKPIDFPTLAQLLRELLDGRVAAEH